MFEFDKHYRIGKLIKHFCAELDYPISRLCRLIAGTRDMRYFQHNAAKSELR